MPDHAVDPPAFAARIRGQPGVTEPLPAGGADARLLDALTAGATAAWQSDLQTRERWWTPEMYHLHGLREEDHAPADYFSLVHEEDVERLREALHASVRDGHHQVQYRVVWPDGSVHWLQGRGRTTRDAEGRPLLIRGVCVNIDHQMREEADLRFLAQASAELAQSTEYEPTLLRIAQLAVPHFADWCAVDLLTPSGTLARVAVAHVDPDKVDLARELHERFPPDPASDTGTWKVLRSGEASLVPLITDEMLAASISDPVQLAALRDLGLHSYMGIPLRDANGVRGVITFISSESRRVFGQRELERASDLASRAAVALQNAELVRALRQSDAAKDVFLATLAHELRNPLAPLVHGLAILRRRAGDVPEVREMLPVLDRQSGQLARLVDDLLDVARISSGKFELRRTRVDLAQVLRAAAETCAPMLQQAGHKFVLDLPSGPVPLEADSVRLVQAFGNLLNNAIRFTQASGEVAVRVRTEGDRVRVSVCDSGCGISPSELARVFDLFTQSERSGLKGRQGLGIGLFLVRRIVDLHEGKVLAESAGPGQGSTFSVILPLASVLQERAVAPAAALRLRRRRVLVVDDNADAADTLVQLLQLIGHEPCVARDGASAVRSVAEKRPEVVLLDIGLPDMSGYEVVEKIRELAGTRPRVIAVTGWGQQQDRERSRTAGFDDHWTKPIDPSLLEEL